MKKIALGITNFELGTKVSQQLTDAGFQVDFIAKDDPVPLDCEITIIPADGWAETDLSDIGSYLIGYADTMTSDEVITWKAKGFNRTILTSALNRNVTDIVAQILDERK
ncbi:MAG: hypothetical protein QF845_02960 [Candidatus Marinimicrobia bacterium]|jgi:hypothetical protein|nr:hypothetical protein [Candidatus Neomarinimicrobiota bacterium]MDP6789476.1 hypothetical protein [Candidatus Neomarinimicrobiota bacterium]MDP7071778.1 hypothetical protein [Candidatus Neomarinimicrobiota bacterium]|tara:strand:+ start:476 stop:802 length:327 start_codon:yes stop_codon:yes gene_type:complete